MDNAIISCIAKIMNQVAEAMQDNNKKQFDCVNKTLENLQESIKNIEERVTKLEVALPLSSDVSEIKFNFHFNKFLF
jgi:archaellum component FlaC